MSKWYGLFPSGLIILAAFVYPIWAGSISGSPKPFDEQGGSWYDWVKMTWIAAYPSDRVIGPSGWPEGEPTGFTTFPRPLKWGDKYKYSKHEWTFEPPPQYTIEDLPDGEYYVWWGVFEFDMVHPRYIGFHSYTYLKEVWRPVHGELIRIAEDIGTSVPKPVVISGGQDVEGVDINRVNWRWRDIEYLERGYKKSYISGEIRYAGALGGKGLLVALFENEDGLGNLDYDHLIYYLVLAEPETHEFHFVAVPTGDLLAVVSLMDKPKWTDPLDEEFQQSPKWAIEVKVEPRWYDNTLTWYSPNPLIFDLSLRPSTAVEPALWGQIKGEQLKK